MESRRFSKFMLEMVLLGLPAISMVHCFSVTPFMQQSFFFDWNIPGQPLPIPVTEQCQTIHITWSRSTAVGPNPTAPYYLQVYSSAYTVPVIIPAGGGLSYDWAVPFAPGTLYQICMFDKFGNTGGCQATYTVIPPSSVPNCANVTFPQQLGVTSIVDNGPMSQYGWVDQCSDISLTPTNGTAPFTLTVAPALHPPYNITSHGNGAINWTVSLNWASPFFISLVDSTGTSWANGPLHAGGGGTIECLAGNITVSGIQEVKLPIVIGSGVGALVVGIVVGILGAFFVLKRHYHRKFKSERFVDSSATEPRAPMFERAQGPNQYRPVPTLGSSGLASLATSHPSSRIDRLGHMSTHYEVEPFSMPDEDGRLPNDGAGVTSPTNYSHNVGGRVISSHESSVAGPNAAPNQLYVLHHDSQVPPVTILHQDGTRIVELPPRYPPYTSVQSEALSEGRSVSDSRSDGARSDGTDVLQQQRLPGPIQKPPRTPQ